MKEIRPFGDVPQKLGVQIKRSFVATRAFSQALTVAADVLKNMQSVREISIFVLCICKFSKEEITITRYNENAYNTIKKFFL